MRHSRPRSPEPAAPGALSPARPIKARRPVLAAAIVLVGVIAGIAPADAGLDQWTTNGPPGQSILALAVDPLAPGTVYAGSDGGGVFRSLDGGATWVAINSGLVNPVVAALAIDPVDPSILYAGTTGGGIFRSADGGETWAPVNTGLTNQVVAAIAIDPATPTRLYAGTWGHGVFRSADSGDSWAQVSAGLVNPVITALVVDPLNPNRVYAGTAGGGVFRTLDRGESWEAPNIGLAFTAVTSLAIDPTSGAPRPLYAGTAGGGVFKSLDAGTTWAPFNGGLVNTVVTSLVIDPAVPATLYAGTTGGDVFRTVNAAVRWDPFNTGLVGSTLVSALAIAPSGLCVHAAPRASGVFDFAHSPDACAPPAVAGAILPSSRSVLVGAAATAFATIINPAGVTAVGCGIAPLTRVPGIFSFQTTDPTTNAVTGSPDTAVDIPPGGLQTYVISLTPSAPFGPADVRFDLGCANTASAPVITGVNTLLLSSSTSPVPDIVALAAASGGIVNIPGPTGTGVFAVATVNLGAGGEIKASADTGSAPLPVSLEICETDPVTSICLARGASVTRTINPGDTPTYAIFVTGHATVPFDPATRRIFVRFTDGGGFTRGSTSVAVRTQ